jgi:hypothetical protein
MTYESVALIESQIAPGVSYTIFKMSHRRRSELMRSIRHLAGRHEFLQASEDLGDKMEAAVVESEISCLYLKWGLKAVTGLTIDGSEATPEMLVDSGPEELFREALAGVRAQAGLTASERKN